MNVLLSSEDMVKILLHLPQKFQSVGPDWANHLLAEGTKVLCLGFLTASEGYYA